MSSELTPLGRFMVEVYDPSVLRGLLPSPLLALAALVVAGAAVHWARHAPEDPDETLTRLAARVIDSRRALVLALAGASSLFAAYVSAVVQEGVPHIQDERAYLFQARLFAQGRAFLEVPPAPLDRALAIDFTVQDRGRWYGRFPPGWPAALAAGVAGGAPWIVNPLLTFAGLLLLARLMRELLPPAEALAAVALAAVSPMVTLMGGSMMSHPLALVGWLIAVLGYRKMIEGCAGAGLAWGLGCGLVLVTRPQEAPVLVAVTMLHAMTRSWRAVLAGLLGLALGALALGAFHQATTRDPLSPPTLRFYAGDRPGFHADAGTYGPEGHTLARALHNCAYQWAITNECLLAWPYLSLVPALVGFASLRRATGFERVLALLGLGHLVLTFAFFNPGFGYGTRFHHALIPLLILLTMRGLSTFARWAGRGGRSAVTVAAVAITLLGALTHYPRRLDELKFHWRVASPEPLLAKYDRAHTAVLVPPLWIESSQEVFASFEAISAPPPLTSSWLVARELPGVEAALRARWPDRSVVHVDAAALASLFSARAGDPVELSAKSR